MQEDSDKKILKNKKHEEIYTGLLNEFKGLCKEEDKSIIEKTISDIVNCVINNLSQKESSLLLNVSRKYDKDYISSHSLNVCILSVKIGLKMALTQERLKSLGFLAIAHAAEDIGFPKEILSEVAREKETDDIMKVVDVYEALTHPPAYRHASASSETLSAIIDSSDIFEKRIIKVLLQEVGLYPEGSWVELTNSDVAKVVKINEEAPLRPVVEIGHEEKKLIDLSQNSLLHIRKGLTNKEAEKMNSEK